MIEKEKQVWICFENDVENMKEEDVERLFDRFYMKRKGENTRRDRTWTDGCKTACQCNRSRSDSGSAPGNGKEAKGSVQTLRFTLVMKKV